MAILATNFVTVLEIAVLVGTDDVQIAVVTIQFVARRNINIFIVESDAAQAAIGAPALEIDFAGIPVDVLLTLLLFKVDSEHAAMTFALLAASYDRGRNQFGKTYGHKNVLIHTVDGTLI